MKNTFTLLLLCSFTFFSNAQKQKSEKKDTSIIIRCGGTVGVDRKPLFIIDGVLADKSDLAKLNPDDIEDISIVKNPDALFCYGTSGANGVVLIKTSKSQIEKNKPKDYPFKVYCIENNNWVLQQDIYNSLEARVPSLRVTNRNNLTTEPKFNIRGDDDTVVIVDGVRFDASILNAINPNDIESIKVAPSAAASNYFRNGYITN